MDILVWNVATGCEIVMRGKCRYDDPNCLQCMHGEVSRAFIYRLCRQIQSQRGYGLSTESRGVDNLCKNRGRHRKDGGEIDIREDSADLDKDLLEPI